MRCMRGLRPVGDRGSSTIDAILIVPLFVMLTFIVVTVAVGWLGGNTAEAAARQGLHAASSYQGTDEQGVDEARAYLDAVAPRLLAGARVEVTRTATTVTVR